MKTKRPDPAPYHDPEGNDLGRSEIPSIWVSIAVAMLIYGLLALGIVDVVVIGVILLVVFVVIIGIGVI